MAKWYRRLGAVVAIASLVALFAFARRSTEALPAIRWDLSAVLGSLAAVTLYSLTMLSTASGWAGLLRAKGEALPYGSALTVLLVSQVAKYLPGNFGHYLGRLALGKEQGLSTGTVISTLWQEAGCGVAAGLASALVLFPTASFGASDFTAGTWRFLGVLGLIAILILGFWLLVRAKVLSSSLLANGGDILPRALLPALWACFGLTLLNFLLLGASATVLAQTVLRVPAPPILATTGVLAAAWMAGFVTPGAPAGIGVREAVLVFGLTPLCGAGVALSLPILLRLVTTIGDGAGFAAGLVLRRRLRKDH